MTYQYSLVFFTVLGQLAAGIVLLICLTNLHEHPKAERRAWQVAFVLGVIASVAAALHLHSLAPAVFSLKGVGSSWLSREILAGVVFGVLVLLRLGNVVTERINWLAGLAGIAFVLIMSQVYFQNNAVPLWHTWGSVLSFVATMLLLGGVAIMVIAPETRKSPRLAISLSAATVGGLFALALPAFWLGGMLTALDPVLLGVFSTVAICVTLTQTACYAVGGVMMAYGLPRNNTWIYLGSALLLVGAIAGRMLFYAANIRLGM